MRRAPRTSTVVSLRIMELLDDAIHECEIGSASTAIPLLSPVRRLTLKLLNDRQILLQACEFALSVQNEQGAVDVSEKLNVEILETAIDVAKAILPTTLAEAEEMLEQIQKQQEQN